MVVNFDMSEPSPYSDHLLITRPLNTSVVKVCYYSNGYVIQMSSIEIPNVVKFYHAFYSSISHGAFLKPILKFSDVQKW